MTTWFRHVPNDRVSEFEAKGWRVVHDLNDCHHGAHAVLMRAEGEAWLPVVGWEGLYEVSNAGAVRSLSRTVRSPGGSRTIPGRLMAIHQKTQGYAAVRLSVGGKKHSRYVAHLVAEAWIGPRPDGMLVCHNDGVRLNNNADNLRYDTQTGNMRDTLAHGTRVLGSDAHASKLTEQDVRAIRRAAVTTEHHFLAKRFGVSRNNIDMIVNRRIWVHLSPEEGEVGTAAANESRLNRIRNDAAARARKRNAIRHAALFGRSDDLGGCR